MALCESFSPDQLAHFLIVSLDPKVLLKLVGRLGTVPRGTRIDALNPWELAWSLTDYYHNDAEVAKAIDKALAKDLGDSRLATAVAAEGGAKAIEWLLLESVDPARDLAWALLRSGGAGAGEAAGRLAQTIVADYDEMEAQAKADDAASSPGEAGPGAEPAAEVPVVVADKELVRESKRARTERDRALRRSQGLKERLAEVETLLAESRRSVKLADAARAKAEDETARAAADRDALKARLDRGLASELDATRAELETAKRRIRSLEGELETSHAIETDLQQRLRTLESARAAKPAAGDPEAEPATAESATWSLPVFSDEFYDSIKRWDRKIIRIAFEKIVRLAEDWRHPSLRAIPLEGLPDSWRIRIASDVRLIYRPLDGGRVEILSLIDREDLQRYIRQAKGRPAG